MTDSSDHIDYSKFTLSLQRLEEQHRHLVYDTEGQPDWVVEGTRESVIQRYEVCLDIGWKMLRRYLYEILGLNDVPANPNWVFKLSAENSLLGGELADWLEYTRIRNDTSHDYSEAKADACLAVVGPYIQDAIVLHERLTGKPWQGPK